MTSRPTIATRVERRRAILREAAERIYDPSTIESQLSDLSGDQSSLLLKLYRSSRADLTTQELRQRAELVKLFRAATSDIEADIFKTFSDLRVDSWDYSLVRRIGRDKTLLDQINNRIRALGGEMRGSLSDGLLDQFKTTWLDSAYRLDSLTPGSQTIKMGLLPDLEIVSMLDEPWSGARFSERLGLITDDMAHRVKQEIIKSMMSEESWQETARRIRGEMGTEGQRSVWRAEMIARTELSHAQTLANIQLYEDNEDVIEKVVWVAHPGACDECKEKHGEDVEEVGYPPDDSHPNCVCGILAIPKSWGDLANAEDGDFSIRPMPKTQWAEANGLGDEL